MKPKYTLSGAIEHIIRRHLVTDYRKAYSRAYDVAQRYIRYCKHAQTDYRYYTVWVKYDDVDWAGGWTIPD